MSKRVLLIKPPSLSSGYRRGTSVLPSLGLSYLASSLREQGVDVRVIDCDIQQVEPDPSVGMIGIGPCLSTEFWQVMDLAKRCRQIFPKSVLIVGGPHFSTISPELAEETHARFPFVDVICRGEGELALGSLAQAMCREDCTSAGIVPDWISKGVVTGQEHTDLDTLPFPARDLLQLQSYRASARRCTHPDVRGLWPTTIISSRGCPHRCSFCCSSKVRRVRNPRHVVDEMTHCCNNLQSRFFIFFDDMFSLGTDLEFRRIELLCELLQRELPSVLWEVELRADVVCRMSDALLARMYSAGCRIVNVGFEKGYQNGLDSLNKGLSVDSFPECVKRLRKAGGYSVNGTFIIGGPGETRSDAERTMDLAAELELDFALFTPLTIHPGTALYELARDRGVVGEFWQTYRRDTEYPLFTGEHLNREEVLSLVKDAYRRFYFRAEYICRRVRDAGGYLGLMQLLQEYECWAERSQERSYCTDPTQNCKTEPP